MHCSRTTRTLLSSPIKDHSYSSLNEEKQYLVTRLQYLFIYYSAKASKYSYRELNEKCFMELMEQVYAVSRVVLVRGSAAWKEIVGLFYKRGRKHGLTFTDFLEMLPEISMFYSPDEEREISLKILIESLMEIYNNEVSIVLEKRVVEYDDPLKNDTVEYLHKLQGDLQMVYKIYFSNECLNKFISEDRGEREEESFRNLCKIMGEFEVFPKLISASSLYLLYNETIKERNVELEGGKQFMSVGKNIGKVFRVNMFVEVLVAVSRVVLPKLRQVDDPEHWEGRQKEMLKILFEYMETVKSREKQSKFKDCRFSFIVLEEYGEVQKVSCREIRVEQQYQHQESRESFFDLLAKIRIG